MRKWILFAMIASTTLLFGQESSMTLSKCEELFLKNNLSLLAGQYNVDIAKASVIGAKLWENPNLSVQLNAYNPEKKRFFDIGPDGDKSITLEQLFHLGNKKHNEVQLARTNADIAQLQLSDLLRNLKLQLRESYFSIYYDNLSYNAINSQMQNLDLLIGEYEKQVTRGNIPMKDYVRLKSLYLDFRSKRSVLYNSIEENRSKLNVLIGLKNVEPAPNPNEIAQYQKQLIISTDSLVDYALKNRPDYLSTEKQVEASAWNLKWQKSMNAPDITLGVNYSQRSGAFPNAWAVSVGIPLALWNRNQGNIKIAKAQEKLADVSKNNAALALTQEVILAQKRWNEAVQNHQIVSEENIKHFQEVADAMFKNFERKNVSLIEFTDFLESYNQSLIQYHQFDKELINACEEINFCTYSKQF